MKRPTLLLIVCILGLGCNINQSNTLAKDEIALKKTTAAIREGFARGDVSAILALHHPNVIKYFGGNNVVVGRAALAKGLISTFRNSKMEFVGNDIESTVFNGNTAVETSIFTFKVIPKNGGSPSFARGRSMVIYVKYKDSPYGWVSLREMAQEPPAIHK